MKSTHRYLSIGLVLLKGRGATMVAVAALVSVFGVFIKGKNVTVKAGTLVEAYVDYDTVVETASRPL